MKLVLEDLARENNVVILYHAFAPEAYLKKGLLNGCLVASKSGLNRIEAEIIIDTSGDADIIARAGGGFEKAIDSGVVQSCTAVFSMTNVDIHKAKSFGKQAMWDAICLANQKGEFNLPRIEGSFHATPNPDMMEANMTRIAEVDTTDVHSVSQAETIGRHQVQDYVNFLIKYMPGFENAFLVNTGSHLGVREGRRIIGDYILTKEDVLAGRKFDDAITRCGQPIEDHHAGADTCWIYVKENGYYHIPYRCIVPKSLTNALTAGRCLSATHDAPASARSSGTAMSMGQAAGIAAVLALNNNNDVRKIDIKDLQNKLQKSGAII